MSEQTYEFALGVLRQPVTDDGSEVWEHVPRRRLIAMLELDDERADQITTLRTQLFKALDKIDGLDSDLIHCREMNAELETEVAHLRQVEAGAVRQADELAAMRGVVERLYLAGRWTCADLGPDREIEIWTAVRDAFGIKPGTATRISVAALTKAEG